MFIDTHAHLYTQHFESDLTDVIENARKEKVNKILLPNIDSSSISRMHKIESEYPEMFHAMMGLHPCSVDSYYAESLATVKSWLDSRPYIAVGEIGIDLYWDKTYHKQQEEAFRIQVRWAHEKNIPIVIHSRESIPEILDILEEMNLSGLQGVFHCFTGGKSEIDRILALDFYMGVGGILTFKKGGVFEVLRHIPIDKCVLETDAPYLTPSPLRGHRNESSYIPIIAEKAAEAYDMNVSDIEKITTKNAIKLFGLNTL